MNGEIKGWVLIGAVLLGIVVLSLVIWGIAWKVMRKRYIAFAEEIGRSIDRMIRWEETGVEENSDQDVSGQAVSTQDNENWIYEDTLLSKTQAKLERLADITSAAAREHQEQKQEIQGIVSDISHQLKTPAANLLMYCETLQNENLPEEKRKECAEVLKIQADKLNFLVQSLMKMSRLESGIIHLHMAEVNLCDTIAEIVRNVRAKAMKKFIKIDIDCPEEYILNYDEKWTAEALFNILDNAVKYTPDGGTIQIRVESLDIYTKVVIEDNGRGISKEHLGDVCKRFYREDKSSREEGVGLGLYLAREIFMMQKGYLRIESEENVGTAVSAYLLN